MIKSAIIHNFESHKKSKLVFHHGVNAIVGPTDGGKSSVIRALLWNINNDQPEGATQDSFRSNWGGDTKVKLGYGDFKVSRYKGTSGNLYQLKEQGIDLQEFKSFRNGVPEEIGKLVNIDGACISEQFDQHFLLSNTPGEVGRMLNAAVDLDLIDTSLSNIDSTNRQLNSEIKNLENQVEELTEEQKEFDFLPQAEKDLLSVERAYSHVKTLTDQQAKLERLLNSIETVSNEVLELNQGNIPEKAINALETKYKAFSGLEKQLLELNIALSKITQCQDEQEELTEEIQELEKQIPEICPLCGK